MSILTNARHERFAQELAKGCSADEAYENAGYSQNRGNCVRLKANESVRARVAELQANASRKVEVTLETIAAQLDEDRDLAHRVEQPTAAVAASMSKAKLYGLVSDKHVLSGPNDGPIQTEDVGAKDELLGRIGQLAARSGTNGSAEKPN